MVFRKEQRQCLMLQKNYSLKFLQKNLVKERDHPVNEAFRTLNRQDRNKPLHYTSQSKIPEIQNKSRILRGIRAKGQRTDKGKPSYWQLVFSQHKSQRFWKWTLVPPCPTQKASLKQCSAAQNLFIISALTLVSASSPLEVQPFFLFLHNPKHFPTHSEPGSSSPKNLLAILLHS